MMRGEDDVREGFRTIFRRHVAGVTVVTYGGDTRPGGFTATSVISVSAEPPTIAFSVSRKSTSGSALATAEFVVVNFLDDSQSELARRFAGQVGERFVSGGYDTLPSGQPVLRDASAWLRARIITRHDVHDSILIVAQVLEVHSDAPDDARLSPLVFLNRRYRKLAPLEG